MQITYSTVTLSILMADITQRPVDAIVNAANSSLLGGGGVDGAIHRAAGPQLLNECKSLHGCHTGQARLTRGYSLPAKYIIHTVGPVWQNGEHHEAELLASCYHQSLQLATERQLSSIAFPAISCGVYGYPAEQAAHIAINEILHFIKHPGSIKLIELIAFSKEIQLILESTLNKALAAATQTAGLNYPE